MPQTRLEKMRKAGLSPQMPDLPAPHMLDWLMDLGPAETVGVGMSGIVRQPISWQTIQAWQQATSISIDPWEARLLRRLSGEWLAETDRAQKPDCPPPYLGIPSEESRKAVERGLERIFDRL